MSQSSTYMAKWRRVSRYWSIPVIAASAALVTVINGSSLIAYFYFLLMAIALYGIAFRRFDAEVVMLYGVYSLITIGIYLIQYWALPDYFGFSGGLGIGTDDNFYFSQAASELPAGFPVREDYIAHINNYSQLLRSATPYSITHPFDILFFNTFGTTFTPLFTREAVRHILKDNKIADVAFVLVAICPFTLSNSLVLVRDGWTATLLMGSIFFLLRKKYVLLIACVLLLFYIRIASGALALAILGVVALIMYREARVHKYLKPVLLASLIGVGAAVAAYTFPIVWDYLLSKGIAESFVREEFIREFVAGRGSGRENPAIAQIMSQPSYIRVPVTFLFYMVSPLFSPSHAFVDGIFVPRSFMASIVYPISFILYLKFIIQAFDYTLSRGNNIYYSLFVVYILSMFILSQMSFQGRHKTMIMPLMYILVASGFVKNRKLGRQIGWIVVLFLVVVQAVHIL